MPGEPGMSMRTDSAGITTTTFSFFLILFLSECESVRVSLGDDATCVSSYIAETDTGVCSDSRGQPLFQ